MFNRFRISLLSLVILGISVTTFAQKSSTQVQGAKQMHAYFLGKTKPLRELAPASSFSVEKRKAKKANKPKTSPKHFENYEALAAQAQPQGDDPIRQRSVPNGQVVLPLFVSEGLTEAESGAQVPDVNGSKGRNEYVQTVNASEIQIFGNDGEELTGAFSANIIWNEIGEASFSDPVVQYDEDADRYLVTDLAGISEILYAVSATSDPLGEYYAYKFVSSGWCDYPKYGITPEAYFVTVNEGQGTEPLYAINRAEMLAGEAMINVQRVDLPGISSKFPTATPVDWNGPIAPVNNDLLVVRLKDDQWGEGNTEDIVELWNITIDWDDANNTTSNNTELITQPYDAEVCGGGQTCIPQMGTNQRLDAIATIIMNKVTYRNFNSHESIVLNFSVATDDETGIRWMELRRTPTSDWEVYQESTLAPGDGLHRWMGAISINSAGAIGLAYSVSGDDYYPSLRFTGRSSSDPLGEMTVTEHEIRTGGSPRIFSNRYGDYFSMTVDPITDDFWFTGEYMAEDNSWATIVTAFQLQRDTNNLAAFAVTSPVDGPDLTDEEIVRVEVKNVGLNPQTDFNVGYLINGNTVIESALIDTLHPDSIYQHEFATTADFSENGFYPITFFIEPAIDDNPLNDTLRVTVQNMPSLDLSLIGVSGNSASNCADSVTIGIAAQNFGTSTLDSFILEAYLNGSALPNVNWSGELVYNESVTIPLFLENLMNGQNDLVIIVKSLNDGQVDEVNTNDTLRTTVNAIIGGEAVTLVANFDFFPNETSWELYSGGVIIESGGPYPGMAFDSVSVEWCLDPDSCYTFVYKDSYGDGVEGYFQDGNYTIRNGAGEVIASLMDPDFGFEETNMFCLNSCALMAEYNVMDASGMQATDGSIMVNVTAGVGPFSYSIDGGINFQPEALFENLAVDTYQVVVIDANGCQIEDDVFVPFIVSTSNIDNVAQMTVSPNPSQDGVYKLTLIGLMDDYNPIKYVIHDNAGRALVYAAIPRVGDHHEGLISLYKYPAGVYYLRAVHEKSSQLLKLVKSEE